MKRQEQFKRFNKLVEIAKNKQFNSENQDPKRKVIVVAPDSANKTNSIEFIPGHTPKRKKKRAAEPTETK